MTRFNSQMIIQEINKFFAIKRWQNSAEFGQQKVYDDNIQNLSLSSHAGL